MNETINRVVLPLYSARPGKNKSLTKEVYPQSGVNQWNAKPRETEIIRNHHELYIPVPKIFRDNFPCFFPNDDVVFSLVTDTGSSFSAKVCQQGGKSIMSNPNKDLGEYVLVELLKHTSNKPLQYSDLEEIGIDSVYIEKRDDVYYISVAPFGEFEKFVTPYL